MAYIISSGITSEGIILEEDSLTVLEGGTVKETTINQWGQAIIQNGGAASRTTVNPLGSMYVLTGGTADIVVINGELPDDEYYYYYGGKFGYYRSGSVLISSGGLVNSATVNSYGRLAVSSGGTATGAEVGADGRLIVFSGGTATGVAAVGAALLTLSVAPDTYVQGTNDGAAFELKDATLSGFNLGSGDSMTVLSGGTASGININNGLFYVASGGSAVGIRTSDFFVDASMYGEDGLPRSGNVIEKGAFISDCVISGAVLREESSATILAGMTADNPTVSGGKLVISSGGVATNIVWTPCNGEVQVEDGADVTFASQFSGVYYRSGGAIVNTEIANDVVLTGEDVNYMYVMAGGTANNTTGGRYGRIFVLSGGAANDSLVNGGYLHVSSGGAASRTSVSYGWDGDMDAWRGGYLYISSGGVADSSFIREKGQIHVSNGGFAINTVLSGIDTDSYVNEDGDRYRRKDFASMCVFSGGTAAETMIENALVTVSSGGVMSNFTVITASAYASSTTNIVVDYETGRTSAIQTPGIHLAAGGKLTGRMTFLNGAKVFATTGAILDFDLTQTSAGADALVNDLSGIDGPLSYTITVDGTQADGTYLLAGGISIFTNVIAVVNTTGKQIGALLVGQKLTYGGTDYTLTMEDAGLAVSVQGAGGGSVGPVADGPKVLSVTADITTSTNMDVLVTATFSEDSAIKQYSLDGENWGTYAGGVLFGSNLTAYFRSIDAAGNISEVAAYSVTNIDRTAPGKPVATADVTALTNRNVTVSATFDEDSVEKEYSLDGETWQEYTDGVVCTKNETVSFRGIDEAGNASEVETYEVINIIDVESDDGPDDGGNNSLLQNGEVNPDIASENFVKKDSGEIFVDTQFSVEVEVGGTEYHNCVGREDPADYARIILESAAKVGFTVEATDKVKMTLFRITEGKKGVATKSLCSVSLSKAGQKESKPVILEAGEYYIGVENKNKKAEETFYNVALSDNCVFYSDGDEGANNWLYDSKTKQWNDYVTEAIPIALDEAALGQSIQLDSHVPSKPNYENFVGFGDDTDIRKVVLHDAAKLSFNVILTGGSGKFAVYYKDAKGKLATVKDLTATFKTSGATKKAAVLDAGTYYLAFQSANAAKGDAVYYTVKLGTDTVIYADSDEGWNNWLYDKKENAVNELMASYAGTYDETWIDFDHDVEHGDYYNFVGLGDTCDYSEIYVDEAGLYNFKIDTTGKAKFTVYSLTRNSKGKWTQKTLGSQTINAVNGATGVTLKKDVKLSATNDELRYFVSMQATDTKKSPEVYYNVMSFPTAVSVSDTLAMPEADLTAGLSFGQSGADMLAAAALDKLAAFDDASAWLDAAKLA